jgi:hypothetical protein
MKNSGNTAKQLLDLPFPPEAEAFIDELERSGQFRIGVEAEQDDEAAEPAQSHDYSFGRGSGHVAIQDWWTTGRIQLRITGALRPEELGVSRLNDSLVLRTQDDLDRVTLEGYLGLIPDASTLRVSFGDGTEWSGEDLISRISSWLAEVPASRAG